MKDKRNLVSKEVTKDELCLRCIFHPLHYSKGKLKREALLPPPNQGRNDVSFLRQLYMSVECCIQHGRKTDMGGLQTFCAVASLTRNDVLNTNLWAETLDSSGKKNGTFADIYYAPMHAGEYVDTTKDIYLDDLNCDLPAHADLRYDSPLEAGTVQTRLRQYASHLVKMMKIEHEES